MHARVVSGSAAFAGRSAERSTLRDAWTAVQAGGATAVHVHGEAGVGKTRLVAQACAEAEQAGLQVLWGRCLLLGTVSMPYLPFVTAFEDWLETASAEERQVVTEAAPALPALVPSLGGVPTEAAGHLVTVDRALTVLAARRPLVLVIDDVQWADATSRDVLSYLLGRMRGRMLVLLTSRDEELVDGDPLHAWLADVRRLPGVTDLPLSRLTLAESAEQVVLTTGTDPGPELVADLFARTGGNAYFNELLLGEVDPETGRLPDRSPEALRGALLATWHRLSPGARDVCRILAVAGRPTSAHVLTAATTAFGRSSDLVLGWLREAADHGVVEPGARVWFRHPLLAEVLHDSLLPDEKTLHHRALVEVLREAAPGEGSRGDLARHFEGAGMLDEAFDAFIDGADEAASVAAYSEQAAMLVRAWDLRDKVAPDVVARHSSVAELATTVAFSARRGGLEGEAARVIDEGRDLLGDEPDPLVRARVLLLWAQFGRANVAQAVGGDLPMAALREALDDARQAPAGSLLAHVLAELGYGHMWRVELSEARRQTDEAVDIARDAGDPFVLTYALGARADCHLMSGDVARARADTEEAREVALASGVAESIGLSTIAASNVLEMTGRWAECADVLLAGHLYTRDHGVQGLADRLGAYAAAALTHVGRLDSAEDVLRSVLSVGLDGETGQYVRIAALLLALRQGRWASAEHLLARVRETDPGFTEKLAPAQAVWCEYSVAVGRPEDALALLTDQVAGDAARLEPHYGDQLLMWAARAAAAVSAAGDSAGALATLDGLLERRAVVEQPPFATAGTNPVSAAWQALFAAESAAVRGGPDAVPRWRDAVAATRTASLRYEEARALVSLGRAVLVDGRSRVEAAASLREARALAGEMGAGALLEQVDSLARMARIPMVEPTAAPPSATNGMDRAGLTRREREVLTHLVAGRTYAEIAAALFISEKTVSVHVSNILRKTGTTNRVDAATWAERVIAAARPSAAPR